jgi:hypothetical protein
MHSVPSVKVNYFVMAKSHEYDASGKHVLRGEIKRIPFVGPTMAWPACVFVASLDCEFSEGTEHVVWFRIYDTRGALITETTPDGSSPFLPQQNGRRLGRVVVASFNGPETGRDDDLDVFEIEQPGAYLFGLVVNGKQLSIVRVEAVDAAR